MILTKIKELIEEYGSSPEDHDPQKVAQEVYDLSQEDAKVAANTKDYWTHLADQADK